MIIQPFDLKEITTDALLINNEIIPVSDQNISWYATLLPKSFYDSSDFLKYSKNRIITLIDDELFEDFVLLDKTEKTIIENNTRKYIKTKEFGDFNTGLKRYTQLNKPLDYNQKTQEFLNRPKNKLTQSKQINVSSENFEYNRPLNLSEHPHINKQPRIQKEYKYNSLNYIRQILKWAKENEIKYIYSINEYRPNIINKSYVTPYIYYTITGSK